MRILVCATAAPLPPLNGLRLQLSPVSASLAVRNEVVVLAYRWPDQHGEAPAGIELRDLDLPELSTASRARKWLTDPRPLGAATAHGPMVAAVRSLLRERDFDVLHVVGWNLAGLAAELPGLPAVLTTYDAWYLNYQAEVELKGRLLRPLYRREARRVKRFERDTYGRYRSVVVVSDEDAGALRELDPAIRLAVVPNGVDTEYFAPRPDIDRDEDLVVLTGVMRWAPNARAAAFLAREVLPLLRARRSRARIAIVGRWPGPGVRALAELEGVEVTGEVPDVRPWLSRAAVFACPMLSGTGIKNKLLEALACEAPCVATPLACQGTELRDGVEVLLAEGAAQTADRIATLLDDPASARRLGTAGRRYAVENHSWEAVGRTYERLLADAIETKGPSFRTAGMARG